MNGYDFLALTIQFISTGMTIDEAYNAAKENCDTINDLDTGSLIEVA